MAKASDKTAGDSLRCVFLVDDHPILLGGLAMLLGQIPRCMVCGEATTAAEALAGIPAARPDLVIRDLSLPDKNGLELIKEIHFIMPELRTHTFSMHDEIIYAKRTIKAGSKGYLMKGADTTLLVAAVNRVLDGGVCLSPQVLELFFAEPGGRGFAQNAAKNAERTGTEDLRIDWRLLYHFPNFGASQHQNQDNQRALRQDQGEAESRRCCKPDVGGSSLGQVGERPGSINRVIYCPHLQRAR